MTSQMITENGFDLANHYDCPLETLGLTAASTEDDIDAAVERELDDIADNYGTLDIASDELRDFLTDWVERERERLSRRDFVLARSDTGDGGWSLHAPGATDEEIGNGDAPYLVCGPADRSLIRAAGWRTMRALPIWVSLLAIVAALIFGHR